MSVTRAGSRVGSGLLALTLLLGLSAAAAPPTAVPPTVVPPAAVPMAEPAAEPPALAAQLGQIQILLERLDALDADLSAIARQALADSDTAADLDERRRHERLYTESSLRLDALRTTRRDLQHQLEALEAALRDRDDGR